MAPANGPANPPADDEWEEVETETQIVLETIGDSFTGIFRGLDQTLSKIWQAHFDGIDDQKGETFFINAGWDLRKRLEKVPVNALTRFTWTGEQNTGQDSPMRLFKVQFKSR